MPSRLLPSHLTLALWASLVAIPAVGATGQQAPTVMGVESEFLRIAVNADGQIVEFVDRQRDDNRCAAGKPLARVKKQGKSYASSKATFSDDLLTLDFGPANVSATLRVKVMKRYVTVEVVSVSSEQIETGQFLEFRSIDDCILFGRRGEEICKVHPRGPVPQLVSGANEIAFSSEQQGDIASRARVTVITEGAALRGTNPPDQVDWDLLHDSEFERTK